MKTYMLSALVSAIVLCSAPACADGLLLQEGFDGTGLPAGWTLSNFSSNPAAEAWFRPANVADTFAAEAGSAGSYIASSVFVGLTDPDGNPTGKIDAVLATPVISLADPTVMTFSTRTLSGNAYGESLRIGAIVSGSFVELLTINPGAGVGAYPETWTQFSVTLPGFGEGVTGRYYFEYLVPDASKAGNFIGLDSVTVAAVPEPGAALLFTTGFAVLGWSARRRMPRS